MKTMNERERMEVIELIGLDAMQLVDAFEVIDACSSADFWLAKCADGRWRSRVCGYDCEESTCYGDTPAEAIDGALRYWADLQAAEPDFSKSAAELTDDPSYRQVMRRRRKPNSSPFNQE